MYSPAITGVAQNAPLSRCCQMIFPSAALAHVSTGARLIVYSRPSCTTGLAAPGESLLSDHSTFAVWVSGDGSSTVIPLEGRNTWSPTTAAEEIASHDDSYFQ